MWLQSEQFLGKYVANTFKVVIQLGSILLFAVVVIFKDRFLDLLGLRHRNKEAVHGTNANLLKLTQVIVGLISAGVLFYQSFSKGLFLFNKNAGL
jgi:undecaprenyl-diphosphatase